MEIASAIENAAIPLFSLSVVLTVASLCREDRWVRVARVVYHLAFVFFAAAPIRVVWGLAAAIVYGIAAVLCDLPSVILAWGSFADIKKIASRGMSYETVELGGEGPPARLAVESDGNTQRANDARVARCVREIVLPSLWSQSLPSGALVSRIPGTRPPQYESEAEESISRHVHVINSHVATILQKHSNNVRICNALCSHVRQLLHVRNLHYSSASEVNMAMTCDAMIQFMCCDVCSISVDCISRGIDTTLVGILPQFNLIHIGTELHELIDTMRRAGNQMRRDYMLLGTPIPREMEE